MTTDHIVVVAQERDARRKERLEKESKDMRHVLELRGADLRTRNAMLAQAIGAAIITPPFHVSSGEIGPPPPFPRVIGRDWPIIPTRRSRRS